MVFTTPDLTLTKQKKNKVLGAQLVEMNKVANIYMIVCCEKQMKSMNFHSELLAILLLVCESTSVLLLVETAKPCT